MKGKKDSENKDARPLSLGEDKNTAINMEDKNTTAAASPLSQGKGSEERKKKVYVSPVIEVTMISMEGGIAASSASMTVEATTGGGEEAPAVEEWTEDGSFTSTPFEM